MPRPIRLTDGSGKWFDADDARQFSPVDRTSPTADEMLLLTSHRQFVLSQPGAGAQRNYSRVDVPTAVQWLRDNGFDADALRALNFLGSFDPRDEM
jgi:biotin operon repressor